MKGLGKMKVHSDNLKIIEATFKAPDGSDKRIDFIGWPDFTTYLERHYGEYIEVNAHVRKEN